MSDLVAAIDRLLDFVAKHHGRDLEPDGPEHRRLKELDAEVYAQCKVAGMTLPRVDCVDCPPDICPPFGHCGVPHTIMQHYKRGIPLHQSKIRAWFYLDPAWEQAFRGLRREAELRTAARAESHREGDIRPSPVIRPSTANAIEAQAASGGNAARTREQVTAVAIAKGQESLVLKAKDQPDFAVPLGVYELFRLFAAKVACGSPGETAGFKELNWSVKGTSDPDDESKASDALRTAIGQLNKALKEQVGTPNNTDRWIVSKKGQGYHLNQSIQWCIEDADLTADLIRYSQSVWGISVDTTKLQENTPLKGQRLPAAPVDRRSSAEKDPEDD